MAVKGQHEAIRKAKAFFGRRVPGHREPQVHCIVTQSGDSCDWHHLDERTPPWWHYVNIVPITRNLNQSIEVRRWKIVPDELAPNALSAKARSLFGQGMFAQAYGCARLGTFVALPARRDAALGYGRDPDKGLELASYCLLNLRPIAAIPFAVDTLRRSVLPVLADPNHRRLVSRRTKARLLAEIGSYFRDYDMPNLAIRYGALAIRELGRLSVMEDYVLGARLAFHRAIALAQIRQTRRSHRWLRRAQEILTDPAAYPEGRANDILWTVRMQLHQGKPNLDHVREQMEEVYRLADRGVVTQWALAETLWTDAAAALSRSPSEAWDIMNRGNALFSQLGIVPTAVLAPHTAQLYREKYPRDLYVLPRQPAGLEEFTKVANQILKLLTSGRSEVTL